MGGAEINAFSFKSVIGNRKYLILMVFASLLKKKIKKI